MTIGNLIHVALPGEITPDNVPIATDQALHKYSTARRVEPWAEYVKGAPANFSDLEALREHGYDLPEDELTWAHVAMAWNKHHAAVPDMHRILLDEDGRAFVWSQNNPQGHVYRWGIGGQWSLYWMVTWNANPENLIAYSPESRRATIGRRGDLNIDGMRATAAQEAIDFVRGNPGGELTDHTGAVIDPDEYVHSRTNHAVMPAALIDHTGQWHTGGNDPHQQAAYQQWVETYLDDLYPAAWLVAVDAILT